jgi:hypothetical protein
LSKQREARISLFFDRK